MSLVDYSSKMAPFGTEGGSKRRNPIKFLRVAGPSPKKGVIVARERTESYESSDSDSLESLGTGSMLLNGCITFCPSPRKQKQSKSKIFFDVTPPDGIRFFRKNSSFLKVADLNMDRASYSSDPSEVSCPNYNFAAVDPPPGVARDPMQKWVALNDGIGSHSPIAPAAMTRLADFGFTSSVNQSMWTPDAKTEKLFKKAKPQDWTKATFKPGCVNLSPTAGKEVLLWTGNFHGSNIPAVRAAGIVNMSAKSLMELLVDSSRVKEYNKMSLGRKDLIVFQDSMDSPGAFGRSVTKVMKSESKPPMIRKTLVFVSVLHAKELVDGSGYLIVSRAVHHPDEAGPSNSVQSEILIGVNLIRKVKGAEDSKCLMVNVNHIRSQVPLMIAKRLGLTAAIGFINDIRAVAR